MNIQDIADFIDLVKNPAKYEALITRLQEEQGRLAAAVETVGKASELDKLRKQVEKERADLQDTFDKKTKDQEKQLEQEILIFKQKQEQLKTTTLYSEKALADSVAKTKEASDLVASFAGRDKELRVREQTVVNKQENLDALIAEYSEKVAKLRSVMG